MCDNRVLINKRNISCVIPDIKFLSLCTVIKVTHSYRIINRLHFYSNSIILFKLKIYKNQIKFFKKKFPLYIVKLNYLSIMCYS